MDVGCGTGKALARLIAHYNGSTIRCIGIEPAGSIRAKAAHAMRGHGNVEFVAMRKPPAKEAACMLFESAFNPARVVLSEPSHTSYNSLDDHGNWWKRFEGHCAHIPPGRRRIVIKKQARPVGRGSEVRARR
jgi:hypothetical protein